MSKVASCSSSMQINPTKLVGLFAVAAVLIGAAVFVTWFLFGRSLNDDVRRMLVTMSNLQTVRVKTELKDSQANYFDGAKLRMGAEGVVDLTDKADLAFDQQFAVDASIDGAQASGQYRRLSAGDYLYFDDAPETDELDLSAFADQWIFIPKGLSLAPLFGGDTMRQLTEEDWQALVKLVNKVDLVETQKTGIIEIIDGDPSLPYSFVVNSEGMKIFLVTWWELRHGQLIDAVSFQKIVADVDGMDDVKGTLYIGRKTFLLHRLTIKSPTLDVKITLSDFNQPVELTAPEEKTKDVRRILSELGFNVAALPSAMTGTASGSSAPSSFGSIPGNSANAAANDDPDEDGLDNTMEFFYGTNARDADTDGDGVSDGDEVSRGKNPKGSGGLFSFGLPF